jgi:predicted Rossmann fold flavoprotein
MTSYDVIILGGGAGGCFTGIRLAELLPGVRICILEAARKPLSKVEISGGGRCNVTHACFDPEVLSGYYPRGNKELIGPFHRFQPADMMEWLEKHGVRLKTEEDGRMFPVTDRSQTIIDCFMNAIRKSKIQMMLSTRATGWQFDKGSNAWQVMLIDKSRLTANYLMIATGSDQRTWDALKQAGHTIIPPVPSLFTFNIRHKDLNALAGISMPDVIASLPAFNLQTSGPLLITHWGLSGPAILKLSAWGARELQACNYIFDVHINWSRETNEKEVLGYVKQTMLKNPKKQVHNLMLYAIPTRLWKFLCHRASLPDRLNCSEISSKQINALVQVVFKDVYKVTGKSTFKEEFVTAGGVELTEVDMTRFESKKLPGLFFSGEVLNIDALTGGFNFQAAWTGAAIAAEAIAGRMKSASG